MKKKYLSLIIVFSLLMTIFMPTVSNAGTTIRQGNKIINTTSSETLIYDGSEHRSTIYAGEIKKDGVTVLNYLYSDDVTRSAVLFDNIRKTLTAEFSDLVPSIVEEQTETGLKELSTTSLNDIDLTTLDADWKNACSVVNQIYGDENLNEVVNSNMYEVNDEFKSTLDALNRPRLEVLDEPIEEDDVIVSHLGTQTTDSVTFTVIDGQLIEIHDVNLIYLSEATTVIYTSVNIGENNQVLKGDLDKNNVVDANDASVALELYKAQNATAEDIAIGDMDENNLIDANDASLILEYFKTHQ
ncbi:MAG: hypothetical protein IKD74_05445 [Clostridia bacterium]|nr:hypothetical protein [Clostridia bacterium]